MKKGIFLSDLSFFIKKKNYLVLIIISVIAIVSIFTYLNQFGLDKFVNNNEVSAPHFINAKPEMDSKKLINLEFRQFMLLVFDEQETFEDNDGPSPQQLIEPTVPSFLIIKSIIYKNNPYDVNAFLLMLADNLNDFSTLSGGAFYFRC